MAQAIVLLVVESMCASLAVLAFFGLGLARLHGRAGIRREGLLPGARAPRWRLRDVEGVVHSTPAAHWQLLVFTDHSLREFPGVVSGLRALVSGEGAPEALVVTRARPEFVHQTLAMLDLDLPAIPVTDTFYTRHNVRVMPFATFIDPEGVVRAAGLVNVHDTVLRMWEIAQVRPATGSNAAMLARPRDQESAA